MVTPTRIVAPVGSEIVLLAGICGPDGHYVMRQPIEWSLSNDSVGNLVDAGDGCDMHACSLLKKHQAGKENSSFAITRTSTESRMITRGTASRDDDVLLKKGQSWVSVTSGSPGVTYVTAVATGAENWEQRRQLATVIWVDAQWVLPGPGIASAGQPHVLTTTVTRQSDNMPASNWIIRYEIAGGSPAVFGPQAQTAVEVTTDASGHGSAQLVPQSPQPGATQVRIQIIAPVNGGDPSSRVIVGQGFTTITWSAAGLTVRVSGPENLAVDGTGSYRIEVVNPGDLVARNAVAVVNVPAFLKFLNSNPAAERFEPRVQWPLGNLGPRESRVLEMSCRAVREGDVRICAQAQAEGNLSAEGCASVRIAGASLAVQLVDPPKTANVGDQVTFNVEVTNTGSTRINNVVARDTFDPGLAHSLGEASPIVRTIGPLEPSAVSRFSVSFLVRKPGRICHTLDVSGEGGHTAVTQACLDVQQITMDVQVTVTGPAQRRVGETAEYVVQISNSGQGPLTNARIAFYAKPSLLPEKASPDYKYLEGGLVWELGTLKPNDVQTRTMQCSCQREDAAADVRGVFSCDQAITRTGTATTAISGGGAPTTSRRTGKAGPSDAAVPAAAPVADAGREAEADSGDEPQAGPAAPAKGTLQVSMADTADPIAVGASTSYILTIKNDRNVSDRNVEITFTIPDGLQFRSFDSGGLGLSERQSADRRTVAIPPISELRPGETMRPLRIELSGAKTGTVKLRADVKSLRSPQPVSVEVETTVR